jgi:hypothetical protein
MTQALCRRCGHPEAEHEATENPEEGGSIISCMRCEDCTYFEEEDEGPVAWGG